MPWPSSAAVNFLLPLTFVAFLDSVPSRALQTTSECPSPLFRLQRHTTAASVNGSRHQQANAFHFFALTQDCQFVLARPDQLTKLSSLHVDPHSRECHPGRVQLLWSLASGQPSLLLLQKRSSNEFCLLPVEMPSPLVVFGDDLFSYSLRTALASFAKCSRPHNSNRQQPFMAEPDLVFPDSLHSDIFYQLESSNKLDWNVHQLQLSLRGHLHAIDQLNVQPMANGLKSSSILLATDPQRRRLFAIPKHINHTTRVAWTCPFDLLFRPAQAKFHHFPLFPAKMEGLSSLHGSVVTGFSADRNVVVFTFERSGRTELYLAKLPPANKREPETRCLLRTSFGLKVGLVSDRTLKELAVKGPLPPMGELSSTSPATFASNRLTPTTLKPTTQKPRTSPMPRARATWMAPANGLTTKTTPIQYYWHRSTTKATTLSSTTSTKTPTTKSPKAGEETWNDDYTEEQEEEKEEAEDEQGGEEEGEDEKEEAEEILFPGDDETPTPAQMVDEESSTSQPEGQKASSAGAGRINGAFLMFGWSLMLGFWRIC